ncbi:hypothetical protein A2U01_0056769, partial [Trifolium medium]|nr:hypothetical protein [Trifolium medium]
VPHGVWVCFTRRAIHLMVLVSGARGCARRGWPQAGSHRAAYMYPIFSASAASLRKRGTRYF